MSHRFKPAKPLRGTKSRMSKTQRVAERIPNEELLLEWLANELPEHRPQLFDAIKPYLKFKLSPGFNRERIPDMVHIPLGKDVSPEMAGKA